MYFGGLCFITDHNTGGLSFLDMTQAVLRAGVGWVQYRDKNASRRKVYEEAIKLKDLAGKHNAVFIVNDYSDIALAVDADGVHLGQDDLPVKEARKILGKGKIIGVSTHCIEQALEAEQAGADYLGFGPVFHTSTKDVGSPRGTVLLGEIKNKVSIPVVAIGGINLENIHSVLETGVDAVAVVSAILKGDIEENAGRFMEIIKAF
ncbi:MAG: thiamine phosphate synthase [Thermodesulfovibrionales bacterium]|jgi:thiamine-phosphate pyrophosphorylase